MRAAQRTGFLAGIDEESAAAAIEAMGSAPTMLAALNLRPMGGAIARVGRDATAFAHRGRRIMATIGAIDSDAARVRAGGEWADALAFRLGVHGAAYVNFMAQRGTPTAEPYPGDTLRRLRDVKREFDPGNLFRSNHNIVPAEAEPEPATV